MSLSLKTSSSPSISPTAILQAIRQHGRLILTLARRDVEGRYRGSLFGLLWAVINPLLMLAVYTFVFSVVFNARWSTGSESKTEFALALFSGLTVFNLFSECINKAPLLVTSNINYVKKVIFPIEVLPMVTLVSALFHYIINLSVWIVFYIIFFGAPSFNIILIPIVTFPFCLLILGVCWFLSSLGVYLRDISQIVGVFTTVLMFLSPIFYPVSALPESFQPIVELSPLTTVVVQVRDIMLFDKGVNWSSLFNQLIVSACVASIGFAWFQKTRKGFADVL